MATLRYIVRILTRDTNGCLVVGGLFVVAAIVTIGVVYMVKSNRSVPVDNSHSVDSSIRVVDSLKVKYDKIKSTSITVTDVDSAFDILSGGTR